MRARAITGMASLAPREGRATQPSSRVYRSERKHAARQPSDSPTAGKPRRRCRLQHFEPGEPSVRNAEAHVLLASPEVRARELQGAAVAVAVLLAVRRAEGDLTRHVLEEPADVGAPFEAQVVAAQPRPVLGVVREQ